MSLGPLPERFLNRPGFVRGYNETEAQVVAKVNRLQKEANTRSWELADAYLELSRLGWSQERIADLAGVNQSTVSRFLGCVRAYEGMKRPFFCDAYEQLCVTHKSEVSTNKPKQRTLKERTPGEDDDTLGIMFEKAVVIGRKGWPNRVKECLRMLNVSQAQAEKVSNLFDLAFKGFIELAGAKKRPAATPKRKKCKKCGTDILLAQTEKRKWMALEESTKGKWDVIDNEVISVDEGPYRAHMLSCFGSKNGRKP